MPEPIPDLATAARASALRVLAAALDQGALFAPMVITERSGGLSVTISVHRDSWTIELNACERAILSVLERADERWSTMRVLAEMNRAGFLFGESTIRHSLAALVRAKYLTSQKKAPSGYAIQRAGTG